MYHPLLSNSILPWNGDNPAMLMMLIHLQKRNHFRPLPHHRFWGPVAASRHHPSRSKCRSAQYEYCSYLILRSLESIPEAICLCNDTSNSESITSQNPTNVGLVDEMHLFYCLEFSMGTAVDDRMKRNSSIGSHVQCQQGASPRIPLVETVEERSLKHLGSS